MLRRNKKGYVQDWLFYALIILVIAVVLIVVNMFLSEINTKIQASDSGTTAKSIMSDNTSRFSIVWDNSFIFIFFIFALGIIISFYVIKTTPALFFPVVIVFAIIIFITAIIGNVYDEFNDNTDIATHSTSFSGMEWIMSHIVELLLIMGFVGVVALFAKNYMG